MELWVWSSKENEGVSTTMHNAVATIDRDPLETIIVSPINVAVYPQV